MHIGCETMKMSIVTTMYYSEPYLESFYSVLLEALQKIEVDDYEIIFVNDGSPDDSLRKVLQFQESNARITVLDLSRNFGHHKAIIAGLSHARGEFVFLIDCDLEEDPGLLAQFWKEMHAPGNGGIDVIYGIQKKRKGGFFERSLGRFFYKALNYLISIEYPADSLTARLMKKRYVESVMRHQEKSLDVWGIFVLTGYNQLGVSTTKKSKGKSTYTLKKKISIALETITSLSHRPLYLIFFIGLLIFALSVVYIIYIIVNSLYYDMSAVMGWSSIIASIWFIGGLTILLLGIISIYLSKIFLEIKNRPLYLIKDIYKKS